MARPTDAAGGPGARLRIGCIAELALQRVQSFLGALYAFDPDLAIELRHLPSAAQLAALRSGELELGLLCDTGDRDGIDVVPIFAGERVAVVVPAGHRIAGHAVVSTGELRGERLLTAPRGADPAVHDALMARARDAGLEFRSVCEWGAGDPRDVLMAVAGGNGVALAPESLLAGVGELATLVARCATDPPVRMPDVVLASPVAAPARTTRLLPTARAAARELHGG